MTDDADEFDIPVVIPLAQFVRNVAPVAYLVGGVVERGALMMLFGPPGVGKSFLAIDWALCVATGRSWHGRETKRGPVLYLPTEGVSGLRRRIQAWCAHHGLTDEEIAAIPLHIATGALALNDPRTLDALCDLPGLERNPVLIVVDTVTGATPGMDQNSSKDMAAFARTCRDLQEIHYPGPTVLLIHHSGHKAANRAKGAVDLLAACDAEAGVSRALRREDVIRITSTKTRNGAPFADIFLKLQDCEGSAVLVEAAEVETGDAKAMNRGDKLFREAVGYAPGSETDARARFDAAYGGSAGARRNAWARALKKATDAGEIDYDARAGLISLRTHT